MDLISIDRRSPEREVECLERARVLAAQFLEKVKGTTDFMWKGEEASAANEPSRYKHPRMPPPQIPSLNYPPSLGHLVKHLSADPCPTAASSPRHPRSR